MKTVAQTVIEADRFYTIAAKGGSVIQAVEKATNGGDIRLGKYEHKPEQEWAFVREGDGVYRIRNRASGKLIDLMMTGTANGTWLHLWEDVGGTSQMWTVEPTPAGTVRLRSSWAAAGKPSPTPWYARSPNANRASSTCFGAVTPKKKAPSPIRSGTSFSRPYTRRRSRSTADSSVAATSRAPTNISAASARSRSCGNN